MKDFFVIGCGELSFRVCGCNEVGTATPGYLFRLPKFKGLVLTDSDTAYSPYATPDLQRSLESVKTISLGGFLNYVRKNPDTILVSFYDFSAGEKFLESLEKASRHPIEIIDYYSFFLENNLTFVFTPAQEERQKILGAPKEWAELRRQLTDDFSKLSLDCYLAAFETKDFRKMRSAYAGIQNRHINRLSRQFSLVPTSSEVYVDIGAWDGDTVMKFVNCTDGYKAIHAFEPGGQAYAKLKNLQFFVENLYTYPQAVSNYTGEIEFFIPDSGVSARVPGDEVPKSAATERVPCTKLDDVLEEATFIKIETEGHEVPVIEGAANLIKKCKPDMCVEAYHYPLDPIRITNAVNKIHRYKHIALRFYSIDAHWFSMLFSDRAPFV